MNKADRTIRAEGTQGESSAPPQHSANPASVYIRKAAARRIAEAVYANEGGEVFFIGELDKAGKVRTVTPLAFGDSCRVPILTNACKPGDVVIHNHPSGNIRPSAADIDIAAALARAGVSSMIVNNKCTAARLVVSLELHKRVQQVAQLTGRAYADHVAQIAADASPIRAIAPRLAGTGEDIFAIENGPDMILLRNIMEETAIADGTRVLICKHGSPFGGGMLRRIFRISNADGTVARYVGEGETADELVHFRPGTVNIQAAVVGRLRPE